MKIEWGAVPEKMDGFHIWCFTCRQKTVKKKLKAEHLDHEVDYVRNSDGARYAFMPDGAVPKAKVEQPFI